MAPRFEGLHLLPSPDVLPEDVAVNPPNVILAAMLAASVKELLDAVDAPLMISTPFTLMLDTLVAELPDTVILALGALAAGRLHSW